MQTDQYYVYDFTSSEPRSKVSELDFEKVKELSKSMSVGSVQMRGCDSKITNQLQKFAKENEELAINLARQSDIAIVYLGGNT